MIENRLGDYLEHMRQAASDALIFVEGLNKEEFAEDKRTQQAVIMSLVIIGEAATKDGSLSRVHCSEPANSMAEHARYA
jgi:uncharacterized protein with HEPN domain